MSSRTIPNLPAQDHRLAACGGLRVLVSHLEERIIEDDFDSFWGMQEAFEQFLHSVNLEEIIAFELDWIRREPFYGPPASSEQQFTIYISNKFVLNLFVVDGIRGRRERLQAVTRNCILGVTSTQPLSLDLYAQRKDIVPDILDRSAVLETLPSRVLHDGEVIRIEAGKIIADLGSDAESIVISLLSPPIHDVMWEYDRTTLKPVRAVSDSLSSSRIDYALQVVSRVGDRSCVPTLIELFDHPAHFVRWSVVKNVMRLDREEGMRLLQRALDDTHPHIRNAARKSLDNIEHHALTAF